MASRLSLLHERVVRCRLCPRLVAHREQTARAKRRAYQDEVYWGRPVPGFGRANARLVFIGLAPGAHGSNRTGRMFTGDASGDFLYAALHRAGLASQPHSVGLEDGLMLNHCYITAAVRCAPPDNRPSAEERATCRNYLIEELQLLKKTRVYLCLGQIAFEELQRALGVKLGRFGHGARYDHGRTYILCSYHVSRQNTQTGRLTPAMFAAVLAQACRLSGLPETAPLDALR